MDSNEEDDEIIEEEDEDTLRERMENLPLEDRVQVREQYRELLAFAIDAATDGDLNMDLIVNGINKATEIMESGKVLFTTEGVRDSGTLKQYSELFQMKVSDQKDDALQFNSNRYAENLITRMKTFATRHDEPENDFPTASQWSKFGGMVGGLLQRAPGFHYLYGSFANEERAPVAAQTKQPAQRKQRDPAAPLTAPKALVKASDVNESEETTRLVDLVWKRLKVVFEQNKRSPISYFEFVLDPHCFTQTVENMFYVSFLIKDGKVGLELDDTGLPVLKLYEEVGEPGRQNRNRGPCNQAIIAIDKKTWRELVETFDVKEAVLKFK